MRLDIFSSLRAAGLRKRFYCGASGQTERHRLDRAAVSVHDVKSESGSLAAARSGILSAEEKGKHPLRKPVKTGLQNVGQFEKICF